MTEHEQILAAIRDLTLAVGSLMEFCHNRLANDKHLAEALVRISSALQIGPTS